MKMLRNIRYFFVLPKWYVKFWRNVSNLYSSYGCSVTNRTRFYFSRISVSSDQSHISYPINRKFYVIFRRWVLRNVLYVRYGTLLIDTYGSTVRYDTLQFLTSRYRTLRKGGKRALAAPGRTSRPCHRSHLLTLPPDTRRSIRSTSPT